MTVTEERPTAVHRPADAAAGRPRPAHRRGPVHQRPHDPGRAAPRRGAQPVRPRPDHVGRHVRRAPPMPGVVAVYTGADLADAVGRADAVRVAGHRRHEEPGALPAGRVARRATSATASPACWPPAKPPRRDAARGDRRRVRAARGGHRPRGRAVATGSSSTTSSAPTRATRGTSRSRAPRVRSTRRSPPRRSRVSERYVQQRLMPMAMEPRAVAAVPQPFGGDITLYSATQIPHILKIMTAITLGIPEHQVRVVAPAVGGGVRLASSTSTPRSCCAWRSPASTACRCAGTRSARENAHGDDPRPRPDPAHRARRRRRRQAHRDPGAAARRHGRLPPARHARHPAARRVPLRRRLRPARRPTTSSARRCSRR